MSTLEEHARVMEEWYSSKGRPLHVYGVTGTGKFNFCKSVAEHFDLKFTTVNVVTGIAELFKQTAPAADLSYWCDSAAPPGQLHGTCVIIQDLELLGQRVREVLQLARCMQYVMVTSTCRKRKAHMSGGLCVHLKRAPIDTLLLQPNFAQFEQLHMRKLLEACSLDARRAALQLQFHCCPKRALEECAACSSESSANMSNLKAPCGGVESWSAFMDSLCAADTFAHRHSCSDGMGGTAAQMVHALASVSCGFKTKTSCKTKTSLKATLKEGFVTQGMTDMQDVDSATSQKIVEKVSSEEVTVQMIISVIEQQQATNIALKKMVREMAKNNKRKRKSNPDSTRKPSGFATPVQVSDELCDLLGEERGSKIARTEVTKKITLYIKGDNPAKTTLTDAEKPKLIHLDEGLKRAFKLDKDESYTISWFDLQKHLKVCYPPSKKEASQEAKKSNGEESKQETWYEQSVKEEREGERAEGETPAKERQKDGKKEEATKGDGGIKKGVKIKKKVVDAT